MIKIKKNIFSILSLTQKIMEPFINVSFKKEGPQTPPETIDISKFNYQLTGVDKSPLFIMIHGLTSAFQTFLNISPHFSKNYKVLIYDQRGHGQSDSVELDYSLDSMAKDLNSLLTHLKLDMEEAIILGHSAGGRTALKFSELFPEKVRALLVEDMDFINKNPESWLETKNKADEMRNINENFADVKIFKEALSKYFSEEEIANFLEKKCVIKSDGRVQLRFKPWVRTLYSYYYRNSDFTEFCEKFHKPILFIEAEKSSAIDDEGKKAIENCKNKNVGLVKIQGSDHTVHRSQEKAFIKVVEEFLNKV